MGVLPLQFQDEDTAESLGLTGKETYSISGLEGQNPLPPTVTVHVDDGTRTRELTVTLRIATPAEEAYYVHGGILPYVLRQLLRSWGKAQGHRRPRGPAGRYSR